MDKRPHARRRRRQRRAPVEIEAAVGRALDSGWFILGGESPRWSAHGARSRKPLIASASETVSTPFTSPCDPWGSATGLKSSCPRTRISRPGSRSPRPARNRCRWNPTLRHITSSPPASRRPSPRGRGSCYRFTCTGSPLIWTRSTRSPGVTACWSSKTRRRLTELSTRGGPLARYQTRRPGASIPARTSVLSGMPVRSRPTARSLPTSCVACATTGRPPNTSTRSSATTAGSTSFRRRY